MSNNNKAQPTPPATSATTNNTTGNMGGGSRLFHTKPSPWQPLRVSSTSAAGHHAVQQKKRLSNASHNSAQSKDANGGGDSATTGMVDSNHSSLSSIHEQVDLLPATNTRFTSSSSGTLANRPQQQRRGSITALQNALNNSAPNIELQANGSNTGSHAMEQRQSSLSHALAGGGTDAAMGRPRRTSGIVGRRRSSMSSTGSQSSNPYIPRGDGGNGESALSAAATKTTLLRRRSSGDYSYGSGDETANSGGSDGVPRRAIRRGSRRISHTGSRADVSSSNQQSRYQRRMSADNVSTAAVYHGRKGPDVQSQLGMQLQMVDAKQSRHHHHYHHAKHSSSSPPRPTATMTRRMSLDLVRHAKALAEAESSESEAEENIDGNDARVAAFMAGEDSAANDKSTVKRKAKNHDQRESDFDGDSSGQLSTITPISSGDEEGSSVSIPRSRSTDSFDDRGDELARRFEQSLGLFNRGTDSRNRTDEGEESGGEDDDSIDLNDIPLPPPIISDASEKRSDTNLSSSPQTSRNVLHDKAKLYSEEKGVGAALDTTVDHDDALDTATVVSQADTVLASNVNRNAPRPAQLRSEEALSLPTQISTGKKKANASRLSGMRRSSPHQFQGGSAEVAVAKPTKLATSKSLDVSSSAVARSSRHGKRSKSTERRDMRGSRLGRRSKSAERRTLRGSGSHGKAGAQAGHHHAHTLWAAAPMKRRGSGSNAA